MAAKYPRFIIMVDGQQAAQAWSHDEAWTQALALWRPGRVVRCEPTQLSIEGEEELGELGATLPPVELDQGLVAV